MPSRFARPFHSLLAALTLLGTFALPARAVTVEPGTTSPSLAAEGCISASGGPGGDCLLACKSRCELGADAAKASLDISNYTLGKRFVETTVYTEFTVSGGSRGASTGIDATVRYDVAWAGGWSVNGAFTDWNGGKAQVSLILTDRSNGNAVVRSAVLHEMTADGFLDIDLISVGFGLDDGSTVNTLAARLTRGHTYRLALKLRLEGKGATNAAIVLDYDGGDWGARWNDLTVALAPDLEDEIEKLKEKLAALEHHTHTYRTGRGEGHNHEEATTSEPVVGDLENMTDDEVRALPFGAPGGVTLPVPSELLRRTPNPVRSGAGTAVRLTLPEAGLVKVELFTVDGRVARTIASEWRPAGEHEVPFDAAGLAPGLYYYRLSAGRFHETRKLTILR